MTRPDLRGIGMTSRRTRERLIAHLADLGIDDPRVLQAMREVPRHIFVDEALAQPGPTRTVRCRSGVARPSRSRGWWRA